MANLLPCASSFWVDGSARPSTQGEGVFDRQSGGTMARIDSEAPPDKAPLPVDLQNAYQRIQMFALACQSVTLEEARAVVAEFDRMEALMPITDPTGYRGIMKTMPQHEALV